MNTAPMTEILVAITSIIMQSEQHRNKFINNIEFFDTWQNAILTNAEIICNKWESDDEDAIDAALNNLENEFKTIFTKENN